MIAPHHLLENGFGQADSTILRNMIGLRAHKDGTELLFSGAPAQRIASLAKTCRFEHFGKKQGLECRGRLAKRLSLGNGRRRERGQ